MAKKTLSKNNVYWAMSDDDTLMWASQINYAENLDLTTSSNFYTISQNPTIQQVTSDDVNIIFEAGWNTFFCDNANNLYKVWLTTPVLTSKRIIATWTNSLYLYMLDTSEDIHRILLSATGGTAWTITTTDTSIPAVTADAFIVNTEDVTYIWIWLNVYRVNNSTGVVESANTFTIWSNVVWLSLVESRLEIFTEEWNYIIRDWIAGSNIRTKYLGTKIGLVRNIGNQNYIITWGSIYALQWYTLIQISFDTFSDILNSTKYNISSINPSIISFQEWIFYLWVQGVVDLSTPWNEFVYWNDSILTFWKKKATAPDARNLFLSKLPSWRRIAQITAVYAKSQPTNSFWKVLYFWYVDDLWVKWLASIWLWGDINGNVGSDWIIVYETFNAWIKDNQKEMLSIKVRADFGNSDSALYLTTIDVNGNLQWAWADITSSKITIADVWPDWLASFTIDPLTFFDFTPALILQQTGSYSRKDSLKVYSLLYEYNDNIRRW